MKIVYIVYREENTMVFNSQVLEYLKLMKNNNTVSLVVFRNHVNFFKKKEVESKLSKYISDYFTFSSLPPLTTKQLDIDSLRLKIEMNKRFDINESLLIICRGEMSTYIASKAFNGYKQAKILFDNRGLPVEEIDMRDKKSLVYRKNKQVKYRATMYAKDNCHFYSFVTNNLREYLVNQYDYCLDKKYFIMPTLNNKKYNDNVTLNIVKESISYNEKNFYITYMGSIAAWQNIDLIFEVFLTIKRQIPLAKLILLTNGSIKLPSFIDEELRKSIFIKSVPHDTVKYFLEVSQLGLVIRDNNIVNKVSAPTKIAEYLSAGVPILYDGEIGVIDDLRKENKETGIIKMSETNWVRKVEKLSISPNKEAIMKTFANYFDMEDNLQRILSEINKSSNDKESEALNIVRR